MAASVGRPTDAHLVIEDGTTIDLVVDDGGVELPPLPIGTHMLVLDHRSEASTTVLVPPPVMPRAARLGRGLGLFAPTYALWSHDEPLPSLRHLAELATGVAAHGVGVVATLPLHAAFLDRPFDTSPYSPASRLHWNEAYVDPTALPSATPEETATVADGDETRWREVGRIRRRQLLDATAALDDDAAAALGEWSAAHPDVADYACFRAGLGGDDSPRVRRSHELGQYLMEEGLRSLRTEAGADLALDLPVGCHPRGFEVWAHPDWFAPGISVGAPPDEFFTGGQDWGFPPLLPGASRRSGHALWAQTVARAGQYAPVLRIDHVMAVHRLWWVPEGHGATDGAYVRYPADELLAVIAIAAHHTGCTVVGEDLGTVPPTVRDLMADVRMLGMHEEQFAVIAGGRPTTVGPDTVAGVRTHDMPAFAVAAAEPGAARYAAHLGLAEAVDPAALLDAVLAELCRGDAYMVMADLDDLLGETRPHNVPGRVTPGTWSRRLARPVSEVVGDPAVQRRLRMLAAAREGRTP